MLLIALLACAPHTASPSNTNTSSFLPPASGPQLPDLKALPWTEQASGLIYSITQEGQGAMPLPGQTVTLNYNGFLVEGPRFDSSYVRGEPFSYTAGKGMVIRGFEESILNMRPGEKRIVIIPPYLGYGEKGAGHMIPPNATLVFELELISAK